MATILVTQDAVTVSLSKMEAIGALHGDVTVPRSAITNVRSLSDGMDEVHGIRAPGTGVPGVMMIGTLHDHGVSTFAVCHGHRPAVLIELEGQTFDRLLVTVDNVDQVVDELD